MAVRDDFAPGEVLAAADLNDTFASKPTKSSGTTEPASPATGDIWYDTNDTPPTAKFYDGTAFQPFSSGVGNADFSNAATGTYTESGISYKYVRYTSSSTLTITEEGLADVLIVGGGGGGGVGDVNTNNGGGGGAGAFYGGITWSTSYLPAGTHRVVIGAGGAQGTKGNDSSLSVYLAEGGGLGRNVYGGGGDGGSGGGASGSSGGGGGGLGRTSLGNNGFGPNAGGGGGGGGGAGGAGSYNPANNQSLGGGAGLSNSITGTAVTYAAGGGSGNGGAGTVNTGNGGGGGNGNSGGAGGAGGSGVVIVRVRT